MDIITYALGKKGTQQAVTDYLDEHLTNPTNPPIDTSLTIAGAAADSKETGNRITDLKEGLNSIVGDFKTIPDYELINGIISSTGKWANISDNYQHILIPITPNGKVEITGNTEYNSNIAFLTSNTAPINNATVDLSTEAGFTARIQLNKGATYTFTVPSDARYMYVLVNNGGNNYTPSSVVIDGRDLSEVIGDALIKVIASTEQNSTRLTNIEASVAGLEESNDYKNIASYGSAQGSITATGKWGNINANYTHVAIPVISGDYVQVIGNADYNSAIAFLKTYSVLNGATADFSDYFSSRISLNKSGHYDYVVPSDATYLVFHKIYGGNDVSPINIQINHIDIMQGLTGNLETALAPSVVNWCAMGDSITAGYYSAFDDSASGASSYTDDRYNTWSWLCAKYNRWRMTNIAVGGSGYLHVGGNSCGYALARNTDFTPYNLVTLAYGINDWKGNNVIGSLTDDATSETPTTVIQAIKATIEAILASNPNIKIIVITPLNCYGYNHDYGTEATNWALGYEFSNSGTLESFAQKLIEVCDYYGIQYIDMTHYSPINRKNLPLMVPDGVHPSLACHKLIAHELSKKITF